MDQITTIIAQELGKPAAHVQAVIDLIDEGNTIPFIARYRKEAHGAMDDTTLRTLEERLKYLRGLNQRKEEVSRAIEEQGKMTEELAASIEKAKTLAEVEDLYRPFKPRRRTRASIAKEKGLEPLAQALFDQGKDLPDPLELAESYVNPELGVETAEEALAGASDIVAEMVSDSAALRARLRTLIQRRGSFGCTGAKEEDSVYRLYYDFSQSVSRMQDHQILAINRGEKEGYLKPSIQVDREEAVALLEREIIRPGSRSEAFLRAAISDGYDRLLEPSMENELRSALTDRANEGAIHNFALNLKPLLMQPPAKGKVTMGLDPGYRMGCKVAVVDPTGKVLDTAVVYPTQGAARREEAIQSLRKLIQKHGVVHIAIGNGTASRETEQMTVDLLKSCPGVSYMVVSEAGASVYSASKLAAEEFPQFDVNLRSAVSIARRLQDPLAELVKIDPKAIGVGQYQHDMPQARLSESLDAVVEDCVNAVGVDLNTASASLLRRVSGLTAATAKNIVTFREENGAYSSRKQLLKVPKLGPKAYEQCAGFLRVPESENVLDHTAVHPESYEAAKTLLMLCGYDLRDVENGGISELEQRVKTLGIQNLADRCGVGLPTLEDIVKELLRPGRDPREELPPPIFRTDLLEIKDLKPGMILTGTVRNVVDFGAFVDVGVHQDGLVHISEIADRYLKHPSEALRVGDDVKVLVLDVDEKKKRISLSIRQAKDAQNVQQAF
ncbi:MAG: RNA-binding transcriptional accessory protein [Oscillospiraceae bacterium]|nr:RNA-binding transcriptional accessory protein [Oscillospiraceae bacterium]